MKRFCATSAEESNSADQVEFSGSESAVLVLS
jgi:hypothetical protein